MKYWSSTFREYQRDFKELLLSEEIRELKALKEGEEKTPSEQIDQSSPQGKSWINEFNENSKGNLNGSEEPGCDSRGNGLPKPDPP